MNSKPISKPFLFTLIGILLFGIPLTLYALLHQQIFKQFAWSTQQSAISQCSTSEGGAVIKVTFANTDGAKDVIVTANDLQTGAFVNLGTIIHEQQKSADIVIGKDGLSSGSVLFKVISADSPTDTTQVAATYFALNGCSSTPTTNFCPTGQQNNQGICSWDTLPGAQGYNVVITETDTNQTIQSTTVDKTATQSAFVMTPDKPYKCVVTPTNECGVGTPAASPVKTCTAPTPTPSPTPTPPACLNGSTSQGTCSWNGLSGAASYNITITDQTNQQNTKYTVQAPNTQLNFPDNGIDTYICSVTANNVCGNSPPTQSPPSSCTVPTPTIPVTTVPSATPTPTPKPTATPTPTPTPLPTATPTPRPTATPTPRPTVTPFPTPTPVVIVTVLTQPPQQTIIHTPGQTQTIVQQGPPQTVVQQPQSTPRPFSPVTPVPTVLPTGNTTPTYILVGTSAILLLAGSLIFFIL